MKKMRKQRVIAYILALVMLFTTGCSSGLYADELQNSISGNSVEDTLNESIPEEDNYSLNSSTESDKEDLNTFVNSISSNDIISDDTEQYHIDFDDWTSVRKWEMMYMPESPSDVYDLPQEWWDNLTETERMHIDFCIGLRPLEDMNAYHDQTVEECIEQINSGVISIEDFFDGNILEGITLDDLYTLKNNNYSMQDM